MNGVVVLQVNGSEHTLSDLLGISEIAPTAPLAPETETPDDQQSSVPTEVDPI